MTQHTALQIRILDIVNTYAPTLEDVQMNARATAAWEVDARRDPTGPEAKGLDDILAVHRTFQQLYWCNTLTRTGGTSSEGGELLEPAA